MKRQGQALLSSLWIFRAIVFVFCLSLFSVPTAFSQDKSLSFDGKKKRKRSGKVQRLKYKFKKKKKVIFKFKKRKKTKRELAEEAARKKKSTKKALGSSVGQSLQKAMDEEQAKLRMQKIKLYKRVIPTLPDDEPTSRRRKATMYYQLAEEYWEQSKFLRFLSLEKHNKAMEQWDKKCRKIGDPSKCPKAPKPDLLKSNAYRSQAITIYRKLLKKFPKYSRADEVMFYLGLNLMETKRHKEGLSRFKTLIKQFSKRGSRFIPDAYTALGEYYFNKNKVQDAMYNYGYSLKTARGFYRKKTTPDDLRVSMRGVHLRAMYMLAWCDFNVGNYEKALKRFKRVVQLSIRYKKTKESRVLLKNDSLRDLILVFSKMDATKVAYDYFKGVMGAQYAYRAGKKLARKYYGQSNYVRSIKMYRFMMGINEKGFKSTLGPDTPVFQNEIVRSAARIWKPKKIYTEVLKLMSYFEPDNPWFKKWEPVKKVYKVAEESAEQTLLEYSTKYHQLAQKETQNKRKKEQYYDFAIKLYDQYLRYFPRTESAYELRFYLGELLYRKAKITSPNVKRLSKKARDYYKRASRHYYLTTLKKGQFKKQASFSEILCYEALAGRTGSAELKGAGKKLRGLRKTKDGKVTWDKKKIKKGSWDARLLKAYQRYLKVVKDKDERLQAFFKTGTIYYSYKHYLKSMDIFSKMAKEFPNHELSRRAAFMILYSYEDLGQWAKLQDSARLFIKDPKLTAKSKFKKEMYYMIIRSGYLYIMEDLKAAKTNDAKLAIAERLVTYEKEFGKEGVWMKRKQKEFTLSPRAANALALAGVQYSTNKRILKAIKVRERIVRLYPEAKFTDQIIYELGGHYEQVADYATAANWYERYAKDYLKKPEEDEAKKKKKKKRRRRRRRKKKKKTSDAEVAKAAAKKRKQKSNAIYKAAAYRRGLAQFDRAIALYKHYIRNFPEDKDLATIYLAIASIYEERKMWKKANAAHEDYLNKYQDEKIGKFLKKSVKLMSKNIDKEGEEWCLKKLRRTKISSKMLDNDKLLYVHTRIAHAYRKMGDKKQMEERYMMVDALGDQTLTAKLKFIKGNTTSRAALAEAKFFLTERRRREYVAIKFEGHSRKDKRVLKNLIKTGRALAGDYTNVAKLLIPKWVLAAVFRQGEIYHLFVDKLYAAPVPKNLPERLRPMYKAALENVALQWEEQALDAYAGVLKKSAQLGLYNEWVRLCEKARNKLARKKNRINPHTIFSKRRSEYALVEPSLAKLRLSSFKMPKKMAPKEEAPKKVMPKKDMKKDGEEKKEDKKDEAKKETKKEKTNS